MATISENLQTIKDSTVNIKNTIINKGGAITGDITTYAQAIDDLDLSQSTQISTSGILKVDGILGGASLNNSYTDNVVGIYYMTDINIFAAKSSDDLYYLRWENANDYNNVVNNLEQSREGKIYELNKDYYTVINGTFRRLSETTLAKNITNDLGTSERYVVSQKTVTENLNNLNLLSQEVAAQLNNLGYTYIGTATPSTIPVTLTEDNKVFYIATEEGDYSNFGVGNISELSIIKSDNGSWKAEGLGTLLKKGIEDLSYIYQKIDWQIGSINIHGIIDNSASNRVRSDIISYYGDYHHIYAPAGYKVSFRWYSQDDAFISSTTWHTGKILLSNIIPENASKLRIVSAYSNDSNIDSMSDFEKYISAKVPLKTVSELHIKQTDEKISILDKEISAVSVLINGGQKTVIPSNSGYIYNGSIYSSSNYKYSDPIHLNEKDVVKVITTGNAFTVISLTDEYGSRYSNLIKIENTNSHEAKEIIYTAEAECYIAITVRVDPSYSISIDSKPIYEVVNNIYNTSSNTGNVTIVAAKEHHYIDGTPPIIEWYLLKDPNTDRFYISKDLVSKQYLFTFTNSSMYSFGILLNGDIIAVRLASTLPLTSSDANRQNPYVIKASENWRVIHELDFGSRIKPCGWLENCGFLALQNGECIFTEYTRISVETCNVWKISGDVLDISNWEIKKTFTLSGEADAGLKHLHAVQQDHYNGILYISTGDYEASSIYASTDNGETYFAVLENNETKCRSLAMTFSENYVCWGNDSVQHVFVRCGRLSNGLIDIENADIVNIPKTEGGALAFYGQSYIREIDSVLLLDRQDGGGTADEIPLYIVNISTLEYKCIGKIRSVGSRVVGLGFRTLFTEWYPTNGIIHFGFGFDGNTKNIIAACGNQEALENSGRETVNNLILRVALYSQSPTISFDTVWV